MLYYDSDGNLDYKYMRWKIKTAIIDFAYLSRFTVRKSILTTRDNIFNKERAVALYKLSTKSYPLITAMPSWRRALAKASLERLTRWWPPEPQGTFSAWEIMDHLSNNLVDDRGHISDYKTSKLIIEVMSYTICNTMSSWDTYKSSIEGRGFPSGAHIEKLLKYAIADSDRNKAEDEKLRQLLSPCDIEQIDLRIIGPYSICALTYARLLNYKTYEKVRKNFSIDALTPKFTVNEQIIIRQTPEAQPAAGFPYPSLTIAGVLTLFLAAGSIVSSCYSGLENRAKELVEKRSREVAELSKASERDALPTRPNQQTITPLSTPTR